MSLTDVVMLAGEVQPAPRVLPCCLPCLGGGPLCGKHSAHTSLRQLPEPNTNARCRSVRRQVALLERWSLWYGGPCASMVTNHRNSCHQRQRRFRRHRVDPHPPGVVVAQPQRLRTQLTWLLLKKPTTACRRNPTDLDCQRSL